MNSNISVITFALPYVNGKLHLGHYYEAVNAQFYYNFIKNYKDVNVLLVSGTDCHGSATTLYCLNNSLDAKTHCEQRKGVLRESYQTLAIEPDFFGSTIDSYHSSVFGWVVDILLDKNNTLSDKDKIFFPLHTQSWVCDKGSVYSDRFVIGECSNCKATNQRAGNCEVCGLELDAKSLLSPKNHLGAHLQLRDTVHLGLNVVGFYNYISSIEPSIPKDLRGKILSTQNEQLRYLDISRDEPYFGLKLNSDKFRNIYNFKDQSFYVWLDALCGYLSFSYKLHIENTSLKFEKESFIKFLSQVQFTHFFGKDIANFHCYLWLNILRLIGVQSLPILVTHGWITSGGEKLAKSSGDEVDLNALSAQQKDALKLYFVSIYNGQGITDFDFNKQSLLELYNTLVVKGLANIFARITKLVEKFNLHNDILTLVCEDEKLDVRYEQLIQEHNYKQFIELLKKDIKIINEDLEHTKPWSLESGVQVRDILLRSYRKWYRCYKALSLIINFSEEQKHNINSLTFTHLAKKINDIDL